MNLVQAQTYPQSDFIWPIKHEVRLSGTFAELRPNHFHTGIDLKSSTGGIGDPVLAAMDGYISRIKVQAGSYGKVLYVNHPNGYTTVYAHLDKFSNEVEAYIKKKQYNREVFSIDLSLDDQTFKVAQGERIGTLGNRGHSFAPHLHFEIRKTQGQIPLNPLLFGLKAKEKGYLAIKGIKVSALSENLNEIQSQKIKRPALGQAKRIYTSSSRVGIAVEAHHYMNDGKNKNGIYWIRMLVDGQEVFRHQYDEMSFSKMRYCNAVTDYAERQKSKEYFHRLFKLPGDKLTYHSTLINKGVIDLEDPNPKRIKIEAASYDGIKDSISFELSSSLESITSTNPSGSSENTWEYNAHYDQEFQRYEDKFFISIPKDALYRSLIIGDKALTVTSTNENNSTLFSPFIQFHKNEEPLHKHAKIGIKVSREDATVNPNKLALILCEEDGTYAYYGGNWEGDYLSCRTRTFGTYCIMEDNTAPSIKALSFQYDMTDKKEIKFEIEDNFDGSPFTYEATIDNKWILFEHDAKTNTIFYTFDKNIGKGEHYLKLLVTDDRDNKNSYESLFIR